jgi:hypothetical protein
MQSLGQALVFCVSVTRGSISLEVDAALHLVQHLCMSIAFIGIFGISFADHANSCIAVLPIS